MKTLRILSFLVGCRYESNSNTSSRMVQVGRRT